MLACICQYLLVSFVLNKNLAKISLDVLLEFLLSDVSEFRD